MDESIVEGCEQGVAQALDNFWKEFGSLEDITSSPYWGYSRGYPILGLVERTLDDAVDRFYRDYAEAFGLILIANSSFSSLLKNRPREISPGLKQVLNKLVVEREELSIKPEYKYLSKLVVVEKAMATIDSLLAVHDLCIACLNQLPKRVTIEQQYHIHTQRKSRRPNSFCELCWRDSEAYENRNKKKTVIGKFKSPLRVELIPATYLSERFCSHHNPTTSHTAYRTDHKYKADFNKKIAELRKRYRLDKQQQDIDWEAAYQQVMQSPDGPAITEWPRMKKIISAFNYISESRIRKQAYKLIKNQHSKTTEILRLNVMGLKQIEIARQLSITRQAVCNALRRERKGSLS